MERINGMKFIEFLKGVFKNMISPADIGNILHITPAISSTMRDSIDLWKQLYKGEAVWLNDNVKSMGLASMIASEKARMATLEMNIKITGGSVRSDFIKSVYDKSIKNSIRSELEYGIALGGFVIKPYVVIGPTGKYEVEVNYTPADHFYPLSFSPSGKITEAAFVDHIITKDFMYSKLEHHKLVDGNKIVVTNTAYKKDVTTGVYELNDTELGVQIPLSDVSDWSALAPEVTINGTNKLLFTYFKMPQANHIDMDSPLGVSGFSRAVDLIRDADEQYSNLLWEFEGGQMAIDVDRTCFNIYKDQKGKEHYENYERISPYYELPKLQDRLFRRTLDLGDDQAYNVFAPQLRDNSIINGLNSILMHIEDVCDLSRGTLSMVSYTEARTATELKIVKQRSYAANQDIQKELERALADTFDIIDRYCNLYKITENGTYEVAYSWDDSIIIDKDSERQIDLLDIQAGLLSKVEYRMKWFGETREQAEEALELIYKQQERDLQLQQKTSEEQTPLERSNQSGKTTEKI